jgi:hypothetical protein
MKVSPTVSYISNNSIEAAAYAVLQRYGQEFDAVTRLPVPVEQIADFMMELSLDWGPIADSDENPVLAFIDPEGRGLG